MSEKKQNDNENSNESFQTENSLSKTEENKSSEESLIEKDKKEETTSKQNKNSNEIDESNDTETDTETDKQLNSILERFGFLFNLKKAEPPEKKLETLDLEGVAKHILKSKNVIFMNGAGISTSAGIPDFRSPTTGLYANLSKYDIPYPEAIFSIDFFRRNPKPFFVLCKELIPSSYKPTTAHYFQRLLVEKGHVLRIYSQNIDALENMANISQEKIIHAHGSFKTGHCINCNSEYSFEWMKEKIEKTEYLNCENEKCLKSSEAINLLKVVKPDITFFGEKLPDNFVNNYHKDFEKCDLLIVMGTSLQVQPFGMLVNLVNPDCPRLLINRDLVGDFIYSIEEEPDKNYRDVYIGQDCDRACLKLAKHLGYNKDLQELIREDLLRLHQI